MESLNSSKKSFPIVQISLSRPILSKIFLVTISRSPQLWIKGHKSNACNADITIFSKDIWPILMSWYMYIVLTKESSMMQSKGMNPENSQGASVSFFLKIAKPYDQIPNEVFLFHTLHIWWLFACNSLRKLSTDLSLPNKDMILHIFNIQILNWKNSSYLL